MDVHFPVRISVLAHQNGLFPSKSLLTSPFRLARFFPAAVCLSLRNAVSYSASAAFSVYDHGYAFSSELHSNVRGVRTRRLRHSPDL